MICDHSLKPLLEVNILVLEHALEVVDAGEQLLFFEGRALQGRLAGRPTAFVPTAFFLYFI